MHTVMVVTYYGSFRTSPELATDVSLCFDIRAIIGNNGFV